MNNSEVGFILGLVPYREHDAMVHFLGTEHGLMRLVLPGYYKATSKQSSLGLEFSKVNYRFNYQENRLNRIIGGELVNAYLNHRENLDWLLWMSLVSELVIRTFDESYHAMYLRSFEKALESVDSSSVIKIVVKIVHMQGFSPDVSGCIHCGETGINAFSIEEGGFVCGNHSHNVREDRNVLIGLNCAFRGLDVADDVSLRVLEIVIEFLQYHGDYRFNSWKLLKDMQ